MKKMSAAEAKTRFGEFLDMAQREPVLVTKKNRPVGVMFSIRDIMDTIWAEEARKAMDEGFVGKDESAKLIAALLDARD